MKFAAIVLVLAVCLFSSTVSTSVKTDRQDELLTTPMLGLYRFDNFSANKLNKKTTRAASGDSVSSNKHRYQWAKNYGYENGYGYGGNPYLKLNSNKHRYQWASNYGYGKGFGFAG